MQSPGDTAVPGSGNQKRDPRQKKGTPGKFTGEHELAAGLGTVVFVVIAVLISGLGYLLFNSIVWPALIGAFLGFIAGFAVYFVLASGTRNKPGH
jgi:uncharacterized membrane protein SpoIIM required for sporulation